MEFSSTTIARLVLGYLKSENCLTAFKEFLTSSLHLKEFTSEKYIPTRYAERTLGDFLSEYAQIYTIIHGRLEESDYYNRCDKNHNLVDQLIYLLGNGKNTRISPVRQRSPYNRRQRLSDVATNTDFIETESIDVNTTPAESLPGNVNSLSKKPKSTEEEECSTSEEQQSISVEVVAQTLLENRELHEKLAETINIVRNTPETSLNASKDSGEKNNSAEIDIDKAIKTIVQRTTADPLFDKLVKDIILGDEDDMEIEIEQSEAVEERSSPPSMDNQRIDEEVVVVHSTPLKSPADTSQQSTKLNSGTKKSSQTNNQLSGIEDSNQAAVQSIIAVSSSEKKLTPPQKPPDNNPPNNDVVFFDGSFDNYLKFNTTPAVTTTASSVQSHMTVNPEGLLMVQPTVSAVAVDKPNPYYFVASQPISAPQPHVNLNSVNVITDHDIMTMPTVIVCDENQAKMTPFVMSSYGNQPSQPKYYSVAPNKSQSNSENLMESITLYQNEMNTALSIPPVDRPTKKKLKTIKPKSFKPAPPKITSASIRIEIEPEKRSDTEHNIQSVIIDTVTPKEQVVDSKKKTTPRSGSHVRALDFSTPLRTIMNAQRLEDAENEILELSVPAETEKPKVKTKSNPSASWDSDLRNLVGVPSRVSPPKKRAKTPKPKSKKKVEVADLNSTIEGGKLIEKALLEATPAKRDADVEKCPDPIDNEPVPTTSKRKEKIATKKALSTSKMRKESEDTEKVKEACESSTKSSSKKKCVVEETVKKEISLTVVKELKALEFLEDASNKLILSPSKLNASKRTLIDSTDGPSSSKAVPETPKVPNNNPPSATKRNIIPLLETPVKHDFPPKTPSFLSPINVSDTPFTKVLKEQLCGVDLTTIPTPKFPVTPNLALTPLDDGYANRPTDYSSSSSYYLPSDNEYNSKSLEKVMIEECHRLENKPVTPGKQLDECDKPKEINVLNEVRIPPPVEDPTKDEELHNTHKAIADKMKTLSNNVIGRKNLNLVKPSSGLSSCSSDSDSSEYSDIEEEECSNKTVILNAAEENSKRYSLRARNTESTSSSVATDAKQITEIISKVEIKSTLSTESVVDKEKEYREAILAEMEEKKRRTIAIFQDEERSTKQTTSKQTVENEDKSKSNRNNNKKAKCPKPPAPKSAKKTPAKPKNNNNTQSTAVVNRRMSTRTRTSVKLFNISNESEKEKKKSEPKETKATAKTIKTSPSEKSETIFLHLSSDDDQLEPFEMVETEMLETSTSSTPLPEKNARKPVEITPAANENKISENSSDFEAENLVKGLKQWGIHLVHNKSPKKQKNQNNISSEKDGDGQLNKDKKESIADSKSDTSPKNNIIHEAKPQDSISNALNAENDKTESKSSELIPKAKPQDSTSIALNAENDKTENNSSELIPNATAQTSNVEFGEKTDVEFDYKLFDTVTTSIVYSPSKPKPKKFSDYDLKVLDKKIDANVYIEELDAEVTRSMSFTPFQFLMQLPSRSSAIPKKSSNVTEDKNKKKCKPLSILYKSLMGESPTPKSAHKNNSPLDQLYSTENTSYKRKLVEKSTTCKTDQHMPSEKHKSVDKKITKPDKVSDKVKKISPSKKEVSKTKSQNLHSSSNKEKKTDVSEKMKKDAANKNLITSSSNAEQQETFPQVKNLDVVDGVIMLNSSFSVDNKDDNDDLMNYAVVGSPDKSTKKRKAEDTEPIQQEKKTKTEECQELLKKIGVDSFLEQLHGN